MRRTTKTLLVTAAVLAAVPWLAAQSQTQSQPPPMGMMQGQGGMMGPMSQMMEACSAMMQGATVGPGQPNEQWRRQGPSLPEKKE